MAVEHRHLECITNNKQHAMAAIAGVPCAVGYAFTNALTIEHNIDRDVDEVWMHT